MSDMIEGDFLARRGAPCGRFALPKRVENTKEHERRRLRAGPMAGPVAGPKGTHPTPKRSQNGFP